MPSSFFGSDIDSGSSEPSFIGKVVLSIALIVSLLIMTWLDRTFAIPAEPGFSASLLQQSYWLLPLLVIFVGMVLVMAVSAALSSSLRTDAPVFCTALACGVVSLRGGTMQSTLFAASGPSVFITLAFETIILFAALFVAWLVLGKLRGQPGEQTPEAVQAQDQENQTGLDEKLLALFTQACAMMAIMILLCRSDAKDQCLASVGIASAAGAAIAVQLVKVRSSVWLWTGPLAVAVFGYVFTAFHADGWQVGVLHGPLAALARPLPIDYVSVGPAGAIVGYWMSGGGQSEEEAADAA